MVLENLYVMKKSDGLVPNVAGLLMFIENAAQSAEKNNIIIITKELQK
jgi:hypothetical protein